MKIFITGSSGFIGFHLCKKLLDKGHNVCGFDSMNTYYDIRLKKARYQILNEYKKFSFIKGKVENQKILSRLILKFKPRVIIHLAAQAGVRHALKDPESYLDSNIKGFLNLVDNLKTNSVKKFIFASSSSVYGEGKKFPQSEEMKPKPINIYSSTKLLNEEIIKDYSNISKMKFIGLRFFTIYGSHGRPDMFLFKLLKSIFKKDFFYLNNYGNHLRDFTHVDDVKMIIKKLINKKIGKKFQIFNISSNKPINILKLISAVSKITSISPKIIKIEKHKADVLKTHGSNIKIKKYLNLKKFRNIYNELLPIVKWYKDNKFYKF